MEGLSEVFVWGSMWPHDQLADKYNMLAVVLEWPNSAVVDSTVKHVQPFDNGSKLAGLSDELYQWVFAAYKADKLLKIVLVAHSH